MFLSNKEEIRILAKRINQRLVRLERAGNTDSNNYINLTSYLEKMPSVKTSGEKPRFKETEMKNIKSKDIKNILSNLRILERKTRRVTKNKAKKDKKIMTERFNKSKFEMSSKDINDLYTFIKTNTNYSFLNKMYGSDQIVEISQEASSKEIDLNDIIDEVMEDYSNRNYTQNELKTAIYDKIEERMVKK